MRSIFGRCIAIAMMAAIAIAWQSPPAHAIHEAARDAARLASGQAVAAAEDAEMAATKAKEAATKAKEAAEEARTAQKDAKAAYDAIKDSDASPTKKAQAEDAANAADTAAMKAEIAAGTRAATGAALGANDPAPSESAMGEADKAGWAAETRATGTAVAVSAISTDTLAVPMDPTDQNVANQSAWDYALAAEMAATTAAGAHFMEDGTTLATDVAPATGAQEDAEQSRTHALSRKSTAETAQTNAEKMQAEAVKQADMAKAQAKTATAVGAEALEAVAVAAEAARDAETDPSQTLITAARDARDAADAAAANAAKYAGSTMPPGDDDDDDDMVGDDDDDDDDGEEMTDGDLSVTPNGVGDLLMFGYWTTKGGRNTLLSLTNTGVFPGKNTAVQIIIFDMDGEKLESFQTCLSRGDSWTAAITPEEDDSALRVANAGDCDDSDDDRRVTPGDNPIPLEADYGYLKAFAMDHSDVLSGSATIVNAAVGFSSIYNATSFMGHADDTKPSAVAYALANEGGVAKEMLVGYWRGLESIGAMTQVVLTFPAGVDEDDEVSLWVTDQDGDDDTFSPYSISMDQRVNMCTFKPSMSMDGEAELACNYGDAMRVEVGEGSFRILNTTAGDGAEGDSAMAKPATSLPVIGMVFQSFSGTNGDFDQAYPIQWREVEGELMPMAMMK